MDKLKLFWLQYGSFVLLLLVALLFALAAAWAKYEPAP